MNAPPTSEPVQWRGAIIGATLFFALSLLLRYFALAYPPSLLWLGGAFALAGALVGHLGMRTTSCIVGPALGMALGLFVGAIVGDEVGGLIPMPEQGGPPAGEIMRISGPTLDGQSLDIKDWQGKVVLVDFWATWCQPCIAELPNLKKAYARFHKDGLEVVGISLDKDKDKLADFVKAQEMPWPQIIFEDASQREWQNPLVRTYNVTGIPMMFLLDREGRIAPVEPRGEVMIPAIERYLTGTDIGNDSGAFGVRTGIFPMGLLIGACIGGFAGIRSGDFLQRLVRRKPAKTEAK
jgi:peroxiredoxin